MPPNYAPVYMGKGGELRPRLGLYNKLNFGVITYLKGNSVRYTFIKFCS